jgi:hypothetical protein
MACSNEPASTFAAENSSLQTAPNFADINRALKLDETDAAIVKSALAEWKHGTSAQNAGARGFTGRRQEMEFVATVAPSLDDQAALQPRQSPLVAPRRAP